MAVTGVGAHPFLLPADADPLDALAEAEIYGDRFAPAEYRQQIAGVVVRRALDRARERMERHVTESVIGVSRPRVDAPDKVTGATRYAADGAGPWVCSTLASFSRRRHTR